MKKNSITLLTGFIFLFCFALLSKFEDRAIVRNIDFAATVKIQDRIDKSAHLRLAALVDNTMEGATFFASPEFASIVVLVLTALAFRKKRWKALLIPILFIVIVLVELYGKSVVHHPSPPFFMIKNPTTIFPQFYVNEQYSYPSGHTARALFIALISWILTKKRPWIGVGLLLYLNLVAVSRIYLGNHWLSDVIGGGLLGGAMGLVVLTIL